MLTEATQGIKRIPHAYRSGLREFKDDVKESHIRTEAGRRELKESHMLTEAGLRGIKRIPHAYRSGLRELKESHMLTEGRLGI